MTTVHRELSLLLPQLDALTYQGVPLQSKSYYVMGQLCVAAAFRGRGVVELMYDMHRQIYLDTYELMVLTISTKNTRSIRVHERIGFEEIHFFNDHHGGWKVYVWDGRFKK
jgi:ribosomal protein S18 acetylase RimI-like enzyme